MEAHLLTVLLREESKRRQWRQVMRHMYAVCVAEPCPTRIAADVVSVDIQILVTSQIVSHPDLATVKAA